MTEIEKRLLIELQKDFPISATPYETIGKRLDLSEKEVINIIHSMKMNGKIRRIGGILNSKKLGYCSELCAVKAPISDLERIAEIINESPAVTHNYQRNSEFNLWFTFIEKEKMYEESLTLIEKKIGLKIFRFPSVFNYKTRVFLDFEYE